MKGRFIFVVFIGLLVLQGCASMQKPWKESVDEASDSRFIPIELWSASTWSGDQTITLTPANFTFGKRGHKSIRGPMAWHHPKTGKTLQVYERINETTQGTKRQLFTLNPDRTGLTKVFDARPGQATRYFSTNAVLFPLGHWRKGEKRFFTFDEFVDGRKVKRTAMIHMRRLSFTYKKVEYAMKYDWILKDEKGQILFHERFIYGPGKSLMYFKNRLKKKSEKGSGSAE